MKCSPVRLSSASSPEKIRSAEPGPKIASNALWSPAFTAVNSAAPASSAVANVLGPTSAGDAGFDVLQATTSMTSAKATNTLERREMPTLRAALEAVRAELGEAAGPDDDAPDPSDDAGAPSETSVPSDDHDEETDESSPTNTADNVF